MTDDLDGEPENWRGKLLEHAKAIGGLGTPGSELAGFVVIGLFADGTSSAGFRLPSWLSPTLAPGYVAEVLRRDALIDREARTVFNDMFEWVE